MKKTMVMALVVLLCGFAGQVLAQGKQIKAGFIYVGPVGDAGWTFSHDQGRQEMEKLPFVEPSTFINRFPVGPSRHGLLMAWCAATII